MDRVKIIKILNDLAKSQGFYSRLVRNLNELTEKEYDRFMSKLEAQHFKDSVELVEYIESMY